MNNFHFALGILLVGAAHSQGGAPAPAVAGGAAASGVTLKLEDGQPLRMTVTRDNPFSPISQRMVFQIQATPVDAPLAGLSVSNGRLKKKSGEYLPGSAIRDGVVVQNDRTVELTLNVPPDTSELSGMIRITGRPLKQDMETAITVFVKDLWIFPLLVVGVGYALSYLTTRWSTTRRQQLLNEFQRARILQAVKDLLAGQQSVPQSAFQKVFSVVDQSEEMARINDTNKEKDLLQQADTELDLARQQLMQTAPAGVPPSSFSTSRIPARVGADILSQIRSGDNLINALGIVLVILLSFTAIWQKDSFSGLADYLTAFIGAFGIDQSVKGLGPILSRLRNGS